MATESAISGALVFPIRESSDLADIVQATARADAVVAVASRQCQSFVRTSSRASLNDSQIPELFRNSRTLGALELEAVPVAVPTSHQRRVADELTRRFSGVHIVKDYRVADIQIGVDDRP